MSDRGIAVSFSFICSSLKCEVIAGMEDVIELIRLNPCYLFYYFANSFVCFFFQMLTATIYIHTIYTRSCEYIIICKLGIFLFMHICICIYIVVGGKEEGEEDDQKETYSTSEWKERVEKWKTRQEKRGLVTKLDDGGNDPGDEDDFL